jgi:hypothetical protein
MRWLRLGERLDCWREAGWTRKRERSWKIGSRQLVARYLIYTKDLREVFWEFDGAGIDRRTARAYLVAAEVYARGEE